MAQHGNALAAFLVIAAVAAAAERREFRVDRIPEANFRFGGVLGERIEANVEQWLLVTPEKNPGLLGMFARRDSGEKPNLVPWAGEFVGKYLISGVQALRMSDDPRLRETLGSVVSRLIELQAEDGYLGPWPKNERLLGHWDLWGHYHVMLGLMLWHEQVGDPRAMTACRKAADLICKTYPGTGRRVHQAGSHEMNMSAIHGLARLHRKTGEPRYLAMAKAILKDFEVAGDYYRLGLKGVEFHRAPRPRWESLHALQGLVELYRITGDESFRRAFLHHWASIRRWDLRNTGGFSSGERATGNPYRNDAIETCCVVAWMAVMIDALRLTGDPTIADGLELATFNAIAGAQHPSGAWCTYNTPMNGKRDPSHVSIRFQARPDAPFLNCCSVNGPRGLGMLSEWAVMRADGALVVNHYGSMTAKTTLADGTPVELAVTGDYPVGEVARLSIRLPEPRPLTLRLRIPSWSAATSVAVNGKEADGVGPGTYLDLARVWKSGDSVTVRLDTRLRYAAGDLEQAGRASVYRGPLLLAWDPRFDPSKESALPTVDVAKLAEAKRAAIDETAAKAAGKHRPWLLVDVPAQGARRVRLCDFASAGATGGIYHAWLPARGLRPPAPVPWQPADGARVSAKGIRFSWRRAAATDSRHTIVIADSPTFERVALAAEATERSWLALHGETMSKLKPGGTYYWKLVARNGHGQTESVPPHKQFVADASLPAGPELFAGPYGERPKDKALTLAPLAGDVRPTYGVLLDAAGWKPAPGPGGKPDTAIELDGRTGRVRYGIGAFPEADFTVAVWVSVTALPKTNYGQVFSAWCRGMDDPLRLVVHKGKLHARIEAGRFYGTDGAPIQIGKWMHAAAVKHGPKLTLYVDGSAIGAADVPGRVVSNAGDVAIGGNPHYHGPEFLAARLADLRVYARALSVEELAKLCPKAMR